MVTAGKERLPSSPIAAAGRSANPAETRGFRIE